jgi:glycosyltransferase involved in cell wall biosynthesis
MKILIVGGNLSAINGYTNAVMEITKGIGKKEPTFLIPVFPLFCNNKKLENSSSFRLISKKISLPVIFAMMKHFHQSYFAIKQYCNPFSFYGFFYFFDDMYHRAIFEEIIDDLKPDVINIHGLFLDIFSFIEVSRNHKIPFCVTIHAVDVNDDNVVLKYNKNFEENEIKKLVEDKIPIITVSSGVSYLIKNALKINNEPIIIQNGVDSDRFIRKGQDISTVRAKFGIPQDKLILLQVGTLNKRKNHISVLKALAEMRGSSKNSLHYVIIGDGPEKPGLEEFCKKNKLKAVCTFTGQISDADLNALYLLSDLFILPSTSEGLALVSLEALAAGLPVIAFEDLQGIQEIYHPDCVQLIKDNNTVSIIDAIEKAIKKKWDKNLIRAYAKKWSWDSANEKYLEIYQNLINKKVEKLYNRSL